MEIVEEDDLVDTASSHVTVNEGVKGTGLATSMSVSSRWRVTQGVV